MGINYIISVIELKQIHKDLERIANALEARNLIDIPLACSVSPVLTATKATEEQQQTITKENKHENM